MTAPRETSIYYSKRKNLTAMILLGIVSAIPFFILITAFIQVELSAFSFIFIALASIIPAIIGLAAYFKYQDSKNKDPQIIISAEGIKIITSNNSYIQYQWSEIDDEKVFLSTKTNSHYLSFTHTTGSEQIAIDPLAIKPELLEKLLRNYRFGLII